MKTVIKEIAIMILSFIIIVLAFGIILYDYIPTDQVEITLSKYEPSNEVKEALDEIATSETSNIILTYEVTDSDLSVYETTKSYNKGKANPFSTYAETQGTIDTNNNNSSNNGTTNNNSNSNVSNTGGNQTNTFYEKNDIK